MLAPERSLFSASTPFLVFVRSSKYLNSSLGRAAKNHFGKVLYGNMYSEIKSGAACNALVAEYVLRKNARGDAKLDMEDSPFLRENLRDPLPSMEKRQRRRRRRQAPAAGAAKAAPSPLSPDNDSVATAASTIIGDGTEPPDAVDRVGKDSLEGTGVNDSYTQDRSAEGRFPQTDINGSSLRKSKERDRGVGGGNERQERLPHRAAQMERTAGLRRRYPSRGTARDLGKNLSPQRSRGGDINTQRVKAGAKMVRKTWLEIDPGTADNVRRRRRAKEIADSSARGDGTHEGERGRRITTSASLKTLSLRDIGERQDNWRGHGNAEDALDRWGEQLNSSPRECRTLPLGPTLPSPSQGTPVWYATAQYFNFVCFISLATWLVPPPKTGFFISS